MTGTEKDSKHFVIEAPSAPRRSRLQESWGILKKNKLAFLGLAIFMIFSIIAITGYFLTSSIQIDLYIRDVHINITVISEPLLDPATVRLQEKLLPPLSKPNLQSLRPENVPRLGIYLFGTDDLGRDVFARMLQGAWVSLTVGFVAVGISVIIGIFMGGISGYFGQDRIRIDQVIATIVLFSGVVLMTVSAVSLGSGLLIIGIAYLLYSVRMKRAFMKKRVPGWVGYLFKDTISIDTLIMRFVDIMLCFPSFFLILTVVALLPASIYNIMIVIGLTSWTGATRFVRAEFLSLREQDFVTAARALGVGSFRIIFRHMLPNAMAPVLVSATIGIAAAILTEAGLSFLGFGVPPPHATWGNILSDGKRFIFDAPWLTFIPGIAILIVVLSFNLFGEGLRDILNPKLRDR
jgi:peptide/nickel transport system permease protein